MSTETRTLDRTTSCFVAAEADGVFALVTDPARLPDWNAAIVRVVDAPEQLSPGTEWVVQLSALGQSWASRATVLEIDPQTRHFVYRSRTDDGNPSSAEWPWDVTVVPGGCEVSVAFALHPATFWRRTLLARIAHGSPAAEIPAARALGTLRRLNWTDDRDRHVRRRRSGAFVYLVDLGAGRWSRSPRFRTGT
jgi:uncharacterized protein YndB with AHSA1/START domain